MRVVYQPKKFDLSFSLNGVCTIGHVLVTGWYLATFDLGARDGQVSIVMI